MQTPEQKKRWYQKNRNRILASRKEKYHSDPEFKEQFKKSVSIYQKNKYHTDPEYKKKMIDKKNNWNKNNKDRINARSSYLYHNDIKRNLSSSLRSRFNIALKRGYKSGSAVKMLGCSIDQFKIYLESKFQPGMTWENKGKYWHIDHIIPFFHFDLTKKEEQERACHYTNLQPLTAIENWKKNKRLT